LDATDFTIDGTKYEDFATYVNSKICFASSKLLWNAKKGACPPYFSGKLLFIVVDLQYGDEAWLGKSTIRRRIMLRIFGEAA
jgi:hypothetical protein